MRQSYLAVEKYWVTQSVHFRLVTKVAFGLGIADGKILFCHGISEGNVDKKILTLDYNDRIVYY